MSKKAVKKVRTKANNATGLNPKQELFCNLYVLNNLLIGNATLSYAEAYGYDLEELPDDDAVYEELEQEDGSIRRGKVIEKSTRAKAANVCAVEGLRLLRNPKARAYITELRVAMLEDRVVDGELAKVILQDQELPAKNTAIKIYNDLRKRTEDKPQTLVVVNNTAALERVYGAAPATA